MSCWFVSLQSQVCSHNDNFELLLGEMVGVILNLQQCKGCLLKVTKQVGLTLVSKFQQNLNFLH